ncbi:MAG: NUDIX domain-containing protein [Verrucomicrobiaceae bacterium]|nr:NUDIX domain-containing protein [Verrucomicrobiaceae bacterium]
MIKNLILDWSGTLADDLPAVLRTTNRMLRHFGVPEMDREEFRQRFRLPYTEFYQEVLPDVSLPELQNLYLQHFPTGAGHVPLLDHAFVFLQTAAKAGRRLVLFSSAPLDHVSAQAKDLGVADFFERLCCGVIDKREQIHALLAEMDMAPEETAFIGDMVHDIDAGKSAGVTTVGTGTGYESMATLLKAAPDVLVPNLAKLPRLLGIQSPIGETLPVATVGALIVDEAGRLLIIKTHKWSHRWGIPGGKIRRGEASIDALRRELREETGLSVSDITFVMVQDCVEPPEFQRSAHFLLLNYVAKCAGSQPLVILNEEAQEFRWVTLQEAMASDLNVPTRLLIEECLQRGLI